MSSVDKKFHEYFVQFIEELSGQFPDEPSLQIAKTVLKDIDSQVLLTKYKTFILPHVSLIENENEEFFTNSNDWFYKLTSPAKVFSIKELWESNRLDDEDREMIWQWFKVFNRIAVSD